MKGRRRRSKRTLLEVGDSVEVLVKDVTASAQGASAWMPGKVSRSLFRGVEVDVRLTDGRVMKSLTSKEVRLVEKGEGLTILDEKK